MAEAASSYDVHGGADRARDTNDENQPQPPAAKKRRTGGGASRGVANLTPEQLSRKRANDREAQRAIRERIKNQIDRLNQRILELESQQPYRDLQIVLREKEAVQAENQDIRKRLESVLSLIQPVVRAPGPVNAGLNELAAAAEREPLTVAHRRHPIAQSNAHAANPSHPSHPSHPAELHSPWLFTPDKFSSEAHDGHDAHANHARRWSAGPDDDRSPFDERLGVDFLLVDNGPRRPVDPNLLPPQPPPQPPPRPPRLASNGDGMQIQHAPSLIPYLTLPRNIAATCPLDGIMLDFLADRQTLAAKGESIDALVGPHYPNFTPFMSPDRAVEAHPLSMLFTDILRTFPDICGLPEQVAIVYCMFLVMRWQIDPTQENYDRMPDWITPRASQLFTPHPCWIDHLPWPRLRDRLISITPFTPFDAFFIPFTTTVSLNWPYEPRDCLLIASKVHVASLAATPSMHASSPYSTVVNAASPPAPPTPQPAASTPSTLNGLAREDDQYLINPAFESHLRNLNNWSLGPAFRSTFPAFGDAVRIKEGR